jgi:inward rectifier potassium channel
LPNGIEKSDLFIQLIFFSSQTITTVGYGHVHPISKAAGIAASTESFIGLLLFAIITGVLFGRFSRPKSHLLYSNNLLISPYKNITAIMFRVANTKQYELLENEAKVILTMSNPLTNKRDFFILHLEIDRISFLPLSWTIVHPIDENSPVFGLSIEELNKRDSEIIILLKGTSDTISQTIYSRHSYKAKDILTGRKFKPLLQKVNRNGTVLINVTDIHLNEPA